MDAVIDAIRSREELSSYETRFINRIVHLWILSELWWELIWNGCCDRYHKKPHKYLPTRMRRTVCFEAQFIQVGSISSTKIVWSANKLKKMLHAQQILSQAPADNVTVAQHSNLYQQEVLMMEHSPGLVSRRNKGWLKEQKMTWKMLYYLTRNLQ